MDGIGKEVTFLSIHRPQLQLSGVPEQFWHILSKKLNDQIFDAGSAFSLLMIDYEGSEKEPHEPIWSVQSTKDINVSDPTQIFLIDHAWTFRTHLARQQLREVPALVSRMGSLVGLNPDDTNDDDVVEKIFNLIWKYAQSYSVNAENISTEDSIPIWYVMDELGSGIQHSDEPNFRCVPFIHLPEGVTYSLLYPLKNVREGEIITRNYVESFSENDLHRKAMLLPWQKFTDYSEDLNQEEPGPEYFLSGHIEESLPSTVPERIFENVDQKIKVYSEYSRINEHLTHPRFEIVNTEVPADILWFTGHFKMYKELSEHSPHKFVNQFPFENVLTIKDLLCIVARRKTTNCSITEDSPRWLPKTFNLNSELVKFISYYHQREINNMDNHWICKPFNLARGLDTHITKNLDFIVRLPSTGPKIAQKYIENPVLFNRPDLIGKVKFDVRYVILLKSVNPLNVYVYKNFFLRFANKPFELNCFDEYEQHFTVMNYSNTNLFRMLCADFITEWNNQYPSHEWVSVENKIFEMIKELFECAIEKPPPCGIAPNKQSRALYAADIMLAWEKDDKGCEIIQPKLLEVNWMPDCDRACQYYPNFYNDIFSLLFINEEPDTCVKVS